MTNMLRPKLALPLLAAVFGLVGCPKKEDPGGKNGAASSSASTATAAKAPEGEHIDATSPLVVTLEGKEVKVASAVFSWSFAGALELYLSASKDLSCTNKRPDGAEFFFVSIPQSPDGKWYAGATIPVTVGVNNATDEYVKNVRSVPASFARIETKKFKVGDDTIEGALELSYATEVLNPKTKVVKVAGKGTFKAKSCLSDDDRKDLLAKPKPPAAEGTKPLAGTVEGKPWEMKTAIAWMRHDDSMKRDWITSIVFYDNADATCEQGAKSIFEGGGISGRQFAVQDPGITDQRKITGLPQPVVVSGADVHPGGFMGLNFNGPAVITFDAIALKEGKSIVGKLAIDSGPKDADHKDAEGKLAGTFKALVCKRTW